MCKVADMSSALGAVAISYNKGAFCAWVGSSVENLAGRKTELLESEPNFNQTVIWQAGDCARKCSRFYLSLTIVRTDATYCGSVAVAVEPQKIADSANILQLPLMAPRGGMKSGRASCGCVITISSRYQLSAVDQIPVSPSCTVVVAEQSYPYPTCTRDGWSILNQLALTSLEQTAFGEECRLAVRTRWCSYVYSACAILGFNYVLDAPITDQQLRLLSAVALQRAASCYTVEKIDDRGPTEVCFGTDEDCDGQSVSVAMFANALLAIPISSAAEFKNFSSALHDLAFVLYEFLKTYYSTAAVIFGSAKAPKRGRQGPTFGHAFVALLRESRKSPTCLHGALIIEATAPISPDLYGSDLDEPPGVLLNADANARERDARHQRKLARQIIVGVRQAKRWYYGDVGIIFTKTWSVDVQPGTLLYAAQQGAPLKFKRKCSCTGKGDRDSMVLTLNRWTPQMRAIDQKRPPYKFGITPGGLNGDRVHAIASVRRGDSRQGGEHDVDYISLNSYVQLRTFAQTMSAFPSASLQDVRKAGAHPVRQNADGSWVIQQHIRLDTI